MNDKSAPIPEVTHNHAGKEDTGDIGLRSYELSGRESIETVGQGSFRAINQGVISTIEDEMQRLPEFMVNESRRVMTYKLSLIL